MAAGAAQPFSVRVFLREGGRVDDWRGGAGPVARRRPGNPGR